MSPEDLSKFQPNLIEGTLSEINFSTDVQSWGLSEKPAILLASRPKKVPLLPTTRPTPKKFSYLSTPNFHFAYNFI